MKTVPTVRIHRSPLPFVLMKPVTRLPILQLYALGLPNVPSNYTAAQRCQPDDMSFSFQTSFVCISQPQIIKVRPRMTFDFRHSWPQKKHVLIEQPLMIQTYRLWPRVQLWPLLPSGLLSCARISGQHHSRSKVNEHRHAGLVRHLSRI